MKKSNNPELYEKLVKVSYLITKPFCYHCYNIVTTSHCPNCHTDDFMRHLEGEGVEYGVEWVIDHILDNHFSIVNDQESYDLWLEEIYPDPVMICGYEMDPIRILKEMDPVTYRCGKSDYESFLADDPDNYFSIDDTNYYSAWEIEKWCDAKIAELGTEEEESNED